MRRLLAATLGLMLVGVATAPGCSEGDSNNDENAAGTQGSEATGGSSNSFGGAQATGGTQYATGGTYAAGGGTNASRTTDARPGVTPARPSTERRASAISTAGGATARPVVPERRGASRVASAPAASWTPAKKLPPAPPATACWAPWRASDYPDADRGQVPPN
jgi:hypothetical protein